MDREHVAQHIEALLFANGDPLAFSTIQKILDIDKTALSFGLDTLKRSLEGRGLELVVSDSKASLVTTTDSGEYVEKLRGEEFSRTLGRAGIEVLTIVLYKGPVSKQDVDYIRGVDSGASLRNLMIRGLVERYENPENKRSFLYKTTIDTLRFLGINSPKELPEYMHTQEKLSSETEEEE